MENIILVIKRFDLASEYKNKRFEDITIDCLGFPVVENAIRYNDIVFVDVDNRTKRLRSGGKRFPKGN